MKARETYEIGELLVQGCDGFNAKVRIDLIREYWDYQFEISGWIDLYGVYTIPFGGLSESVHDHNIESQQLKMLESALVRAMRKLRHNYEIMVAKK